MLKLLSLFFCLFYLFLISDADAVQPPSQRLAISFILPENLLHGTSEITLPPDTGTTIHFGDLTTIGVSINGKMADLPEDDPTGMEIKPLASEQKITITYEKKFTGSEHMPAAVSEKGIALTGLWHPVLDRDTLFELAAKIPSHFEAVSEAEEIITTQNQEGKDVRFHFPYPAHSLNFVAGPYIVEQVPFGKDKTLFTYFYKEDQHLAATYREKTLGYLARYEALLGPYPYTRFSVVENRFPTGYAMPTFTLLGQVVLRLPFIQDTSLGHEVLHAWFGNSIRIAEGSGNWAEGLTTYLADHAYKADKAADITFRKEQLIKYQNYVSDENPITLQEFQGSAGHFNPAEQGVRAVGYQKASMLFHMLYTSLGEEVFNASLRDFYNRMRHKRAAWEDLQTSFENRSNSSLADFFDQWLKRADVPMLRINDLAIREKNGQPLLSFTLVQKNKKAYELIVPVTIVLPDREVRKIIQTSTSKKEVQIPLADLPSKMVIDPDYDLMRVLSPDELPPVWSRFAGAPKKLAILATDAKDDVFSPLIEMLETIDCETVLSDEADDSDISGASVIFLGPTSELALSLFARPEHNKVGMTVDVRKNPLNHSEVAILVSADDPQEVAPAARKLKHYGKYSSLVFKNGRISEKKITDTDSGQNYSLDVPPKGIEVGKALDFDDIITELSKKRVVYVGESHTDYADHLLQLRVIRALYKKNPNLAIGMEMFTHPAQDALDRFISRQTDEKTFLKESHYYKIWRFDYRLYRDIINFARRHQVPIVALNLERDIVSTVFKNGGIAALTPEQQEMLPAERDLDMPGYQDRISRVYKMHGGHQENGGGQFKDFLQSQALWDETMAETIAEYLKAHPEENMIVLAGQGHVMKDSAIPPRVARRIPVQQAVVVNAAHIDIDPALADYSIFTSPAHLPAAAIMGVLLDGKDDGVAIKAVTPKGRAKAAGIRKNDILVAIDNEPIATVEDVKAIMLDKKKGQRLTVRIKRPRAIFADEELEIEIVL